MDWIKVTPETIPPDMEPVIVTAFHQGRVEGEKERNKDVFTDVRWNKMLQAFEIKEWNICQYEWTTWHDLKVTHWMPYPEPAED